MNEAARLVGASAGYIRLLEDDLLVPSAATASAAGYLAEEAESRPTIAVAAEGASPVGRGRGSGRRHSRVAAMPDCRAGWDVYQITDHGITLEATIRRTKYWKDAELN